MELGIIGRHPDILQTALDTAARLGHVARGTLNDAEALAWVQSGAIAGLVIGGGVESTSRQQLLAACKQAGVRPIEVFGPANLDQVLAGL